MNARATLVIVLCLVLGLCAAPSPVQSSDLPARSAPLVGLLTFQAGGQIAPFAPGLACLAPLDHPWWGMLPRSAAGPAPTAACNLAAASDSLGDVLGDWQGDEGVTPIHLQGNDERRGLVVSNPTSDITTRIDPIAGGTLVYTDTQGLPTTIQVPSGAVDACTDLVYTPLALPTQPLPPGDQYAHHAFFLYAYPCTDRHYVYLPFVARNAVPTAQVMPLSPSVPAQDDPVFQVPVTMTIHYSDADVVGIDENTLRVVYWTGLIWADMIDTCLPPSPYVRDPGNNVISLEFCHMSQGALVGN